MKAGIYCRISLAAEGDHVKTDDQERICRDLADKLGWEVADGYGHPLPTGVYTDHSRSAWQRNRNRPAWNQMLADVDKGVINGIIVYHGDRLVRRGQDLAKLFDLAESKGVKLASPTGTHDLDHDRMMLWIRAAFAEEESQRTSERRKAQYERWRRDGRVRAGGRGGRAYGFETDGLTLIAAECDVIREMARRILSGETIGSAGRWATASGARTPLGNEFAHSTVRKMLARPRYAGLMPDGESKAAWQPVLDRETWEELQLALDARSAGFGRATNARRWLLSGIATCSECGQTVQAKGGAGYTCVFKGCGKVYRIAEHLDAYVSAAVVGFLSHPLAPRPDAPAGPGHGAEWTALTNERADVEDQLADYAKSAGRSRLLGRRLDSIDARMAQLRELADTSARDRLVSQYEGISLKAFLDLPLATRRALVRATLTVTVLPSSKRGPGFRTEDVRLEPL